LSEGGAPPLTASNPRASIAAGKTAVLADTAVRDQMLDKTMPLTRADDSRANATPPAATLGISRAFDSMAATQRLASRTGMEREAKEAASTMRFVAPKPAVPGRGAYSVAPAAAAGGWSRREIGVFATGIVVAIAIAAAIAAT
jgi:hypothetical protein